MSRLKKLTKSEVPPDIRALYEDVGAKRGNVPNMFRVYAHRPEILKTMARTSTPSRTAVPCRRGRKSWWRRSSRG